MDINKLISSINKDKLASSMQSLDKLMNSPEGRELQAKLKNVDKNSFMQKLSTMNEGQIPNEEVINQLTKDPDLIKKLNEFLSK